MSLWLAGALDRLIRCLALLGQLVLLFIVVTICYDVIMRCVLVAPTTWSLEVHLPDRVPGGHPGR